MSRKRKMNKYCVFQKPLLGWESWELVHTFDHTKELSFYYPNYLIEADSEKSARKITINRIFNESTNRSDESLVLSTVFYGMCGFDLSDDEINKKLGEKDANILRRFYKKYTWEAMFERNVSFEKDLDESDYKALRTLNPDNLYWFYETELWTEIVVLRIDQVIDNEI